MAMKEFKQQLISKLGLDAATADLATNKTLAIVKTIGGKELFSKICEGIDGKMKSGDAGSISATVEDEGGSGQLDQISAMDASDIGGSLGRAEGLGSALATAGMSATKMDDFATMFVQFIRDNAGSEVADQLLKKVPMIQGMIK